MEKARVVHGCKITPGYGRILVAIAQRAEAVPISTYHRISERALERMGLLRATHVEGSTVPHWRMTKAGLSVVEMLLASDDPPPAAPPSAAPYTVGR